MATPATFLHRAWGLTIASEMPLAPYLESASGDGLVDVVVARPREGGDPPQTAARADCARRGVRLAWPGLVFDVCEGARVTVVDDGEASADEFAQFVAGPVMGALLTQRGYYVLHASAVRLDGEVVAFTAASGVGKSTLAMQLAACGAEYLADDMVVVRLEPAGAQVVLGPRLAKVSDDACVPGWTVVAREGLAGRCLVRVVPGSTSDGCRAPLGRLCVVTDSETGDGVTITSLRGARRLVAVAEADFGAPLVPSAARAASLARARDLAAVLPVQQLARPRRHDVGPAVVRALGATRSPSSGSVA